MIRPANRATSQMPRQIPLNNPLMPRVTLAYPALLDNMDVIDAATVPGRRIDADSTTRAWDQAD